MPPLPAQSTISVMNSTQTNIALILPDVDSPKILQFNCNRLRSKLQEIVRFMEQHNILIADIQEPKFTAIQDHPS